MPTLIELMRERRAGRKQADLADFDARMQRGEVSAGAAVPDFEQSAIEHYREMLRNGEISPGEARKLLQKKLHERPDVEERAFQTGGATYSPTYGGALTGLGLGAGLMWGLGQLGRPFGAKPPSLPEQVKAMVTPTALLPRVGSWWSLLPLGLAGAFYGMRPLEDPAYQRGERGYWASLGASLSGAGKETRRRMEEAQQRYGTVGAIPLHALNVAMDPIGGILAGGTKAKELLMGKESAWRELAEQRIKEALAEGGR